MSLKCVIELEKTKKIEKKKNKSSCCCSPGNLSLRFTLNYFHYSLTQGQFHSRVSVSFFGNPLFVLGLGRFRWVVYTLPNDLIDFLFACFTLNNCYVGQKDSTNFDTIELKLRLPFKVNFFIAMACFVVDDKEETFIIKW